MLQDFKKFILRGNTVDLAVAVVIGAAFGAIVTAFVSDLIQPLINGFTGSKNATVQGVARFHVLGHLFIFPWGDFVSKVITFLLIAIVVFFLVVQPVNKLMTLASRDKSTPDPTTKKCPECLSEVPIAASRCAFCTSKLNAA